MKYIKRNPQIRFTFPRVQLDNNISIFFYNPDNGKDFVSNQIGAFIWLSIEELTSIESLIKELSLINLNTNMDIIKSDTLKICNLFVKQNLAEIVEIDGKIYENG